MDEKLRSYIHDLGNKLSRFQQPIRTLKGVTQTSQIILAREKLEAILETTTEIFLEFKTYLAHQHAFESLGTYYIHSTAEQLKNQTNRITHTYSLKEFIVNFDSSAGPTPYYCNQELIQQVFENAFENSAKAGATRIIVMFRELPRIIEITIADNGRGLTLDEISEITWGYSTSGSSGLGTQIIRDNILRAGGTVDWNSIPAIGTCLTIKLKKVTGALS